MKKAANHRFSAFMKALKQLGIIANQKEVADNLKNEKGQSISQPYISAISKAKRPLSSSILDQLIELYPFTTSDFFISGTSYMFDIKLMLRWLCDQEGITQKDLAKKLDMPLSSLNKLGPHHNSDDWQPILNYFNDKRGSHIIYAEIQKFNKVAGYVEEKFEGADEPTIRFLELIDAIKRAGLEGIATDKDFAEQIDIIPNMIANMRSKMVTQKVTVKMLAKTSLKFPQTNINRVLNGEGDIFISASNAMGVIQMMRIDQLRTNDKIDLVIKKLSELEHS